MILDTCPIYWSHWASSFSVPYRGKNSLDQHDKDVKIPDQLLKYISWFLNLLVLWLMQYFLRRRVLVKGQVFPSMLLAKVPRHTAWFDLCIPEHLATDELFPWQTTMWNLSTQDGYSCSCNKKRTLLYPWIQSVLSTPGAKNHWIMR